MNHHPKSSLPRSERETWSILDVCSFLECSRPHVYKLMASQGLPHVRLGALLRFRRDDVVAWLGAQVKTGKGAA